MLKFFQSARPIKLAAALRDSFAGITLAAMNIPQALGYTRIAGMPVVTGLYSLLLPAFAFAAFGSSRYLVVSADSATAAIFAAKLSYMAPPASARYVALASAVALLTAAFLLVARVLKMGFIADFLSQTVLTGFLTGVGFQVGIAVLSQMLGVPVSSRRTLLQLGQVVRELPHVHLPSVAVSAVAVLILLLFRRFAPSVPGPLMVVAGAIAASAMWHFSGHGIAVIGPVAGGLPHFGLPDVRWKDLPQLVSVAGSCCIMIITQSAATARIYAERHQQKLDADEDLAGLSAANAVAALSGTFVVNGSPTQTAMVESAGAQSQVAQMATASVVALVLLFLTRPLQYLPHCVLGALVFVIAIRLIKLRTILELRRESPGEFALSLTTAAVVVAAGVEQGILVAMVVSLLRVVHHSYHPSTGVLVANPLGSWDLVPVTPNAMTQPGLVFYRFGAELFYANANRFAEEVTCLGSGSPSSVRWLLVDAEAIGRMDYSSSRVLAELIRDLTNRGIQFGFARVSWGLKADLVRHHVIELIDPAMIFARLHDARKAFAKLPVPHAEGADPSNGAV